MSVISVLSRELTRRRKPTSAQVAAEWTIPDRMSSCSLGRRLTPGALSGTGTSGRRRYFQDPRLCPNCAPRPPRRDELDRGASADSGEASNKDRKVSRGRDGRSTRRPDPLLAFASRLRSIPGMRPDPRTEAELREVLARIADAAERRDVDGAMRRFADAADE